jgi:hypothetical protein
MLFVVCCCCYDEFKSDIKNTDNGPLVADAVCSTLYCSAAVAVVEYHLAITIVHHCRLVGLSGGGGHRALRVNFFSESSPKKVRVGLTPKPKFQNIYYIHDLIEHTLKYRKPAGTTVQFGCLRAVRSYQRCTYQ